MRSTPLRRERTAIPRGVGRNIQVKGIPNGLSVQVSVGSLTWYYVVSQGTVPRGRPPFDTLIMKVCLSDLVLKDYRKSG